LAGEKAENLDLEVNHSEVEIRLRNFEAPSKANIPPESQVHVQNKTSNYLLKGIVPADDTGGNPKFKIFNCSICCVSNDSAMPRCMLLFARYEMLLNDVRRITSEFHSCRALQTPTTRRIQPARPSLRFRAAAHRTARASIWLERMEASRSCQLLDGSLRAGIHIQ